MDAVVEWVDARKRLPRAGTGGRVRVRIALALKIGPVMGGQRFSAV